MTQSLEKIDRYTTQLLQSKKRISDILQTVPEKQRFLTRPCPIHDLLSVKTLTSTEIPLDILEQLMSAGFNVNEVNEFNRTSLDVAVENCHYDVIRLLIKHGAKSASDYEIMDEITFGSVEIFPLISLASQPNVPLDLLDLLATPSNLNYFRMENRDLPLHQAVKHGHAATALHLIKLGANVDQRDGNRRLPLEYFARHHRNQQNSELLMSLPPSKNCQGVDILTSICVVLINAERPPNRIASLFETFHQLLQRLRFDELLQVVMECRGRWDNQGYMTVNNTEIGKYIYLERHYAVSYLCSLILTEMQFDFASTPHEIADKLPNSVETEEFTFAQATDTLWKNYRRQCNVRSLLRLCILRTRNSMSSLDDESFLSLPVPPYIRKLLTYRDISEKIFEEWKQGPIKFS